MPDAQLSRRQARFDLTLDGLTFTRTGRDAERRGVPPVHHVPWVDVLGARVERTGKGRTVLRVEVRDTTTVPDHRLDPHAFKVSNGDTAAADDVVERIEAEVATRRRWREQGADVPAPGTDSWPEDTSAIA